MGSGNDNVKHTVENINIGYTQQEIENKKAKAQNELDDFLNNDDYDVEIETEIEK